MSKVSVWAKFDLQPGKRDEAIGIIQEAIDAVESEPGTLMYLVHTDPENEDLLYLYEMYENQDALVAHGGAEWIKAFGPKLRTVLAGRVSMQFFSPVAGKGL